MHGNKKTSKNDLKFIFIEKAIKKHGNIYDYNQIDYKNCKEKVKIICSRHGDFWQTPDSHLNTNGCKKCSLEFLSEKQRKTLDIFRAQAIDIHKNKYSYEKSIYINNETKVIITCPEHGDFSQTPSNHLLGKGCPRCKPIKLKNKFSFTQEKYIQKVKDRWGDKFLLDKIVYKGIDNKIIVGCKEHGDFELTAYSLLKGKHPCPKCCLKLRGENRRKDDEYFYQKFKQKHNNKYQYKAILREGKDSWVEIECPNHGPFRQLISNHNKHGCPRCSLSNTSIEKFIERFLEKNNINFIKNENRVIKPQEIDFYLPDYNIGIECNGIFWHSELSGKDNKYHIKKYNKCIEKGVYLINIFEHEIKNNPNKVINRLKSILNINKYKIFARKCEVIHIRKEFKKKFLHKYHIQGNDSSSVMLGLKYKNKIISVMTFGKRRLSLGAKNKEGYELLRFCSINNFKIIGGASKMINFFEKTYQPKELISYADKRWSNGEFYKKVGFNLIRESKPNYWYFKGNQVLHRFNFAKMFLKQKLEKFDPKKTEWENMKENGWNRFWDCGNFVFLKKYYNE